MKKSGLVSFANNDTEQEMNMENQKLLLILQKLIPLYMEKYNVPGLALAVTQDEKIIASLEFGVKNIMTREHVVSSTVFEAASLSKPIVAYAALQMCQEELIDINKPLSKYLSKPYQGNPDNLSTITLRHVLTHTSGFPTANLKIGDSLKINSYPGSQFAYSGESFRYLAHVMEQIAKIPFNEYMKKNVFNPLKMNDSSYTWEEQYNLQAASPHDTQSNLREKWKPKKPVSSFSLHTTAIDFAKFLIEVLPYLNNDNLCQQVSFPINTYLSWCLGWGKEKKSDSKIYWHSGDNGTFQCFSIILCKQNVGIIIMTNSANGLKLCRDVLIETIGKEHPLIDWEFENDDNVDFPDGDILSNWWEMYGV